MLHCLRVAFPAAWTLSDDVIDHPLPYTQLTWGGRLDLLEVANALATIGGDAGLIGRLRRRDHHEGAVAELLAGLFLVDCGATLATAPPSPATGARCEWIAQTSHGARFAIEVKRPERADHHKDVLRVETHLHLALMQALAPALDPRPDLYATVRFARSAWAIGNRLAIDDGRSEALCADAAARVAAALADGATPSAVDLGAIGSLVLEAATGGPRTLGADLTQPDVRTLYLHARRSLNDAYRQVQGRGIAGVIFLDLDGDGLVANALPRLARWADDKADLGAVVLVDRTAIERGFQTTMTVLPGPRIDGAWTLLAAGLSTCDRGHLHYSASCSLPAPCPFTWLPRAVA